MPTYEFECSACNHLFEDKLSVADMSKPLSEPCPSCKVEGQVKRLMSQTSIGDPMRLGVTKRRESPLFTEQMKRIRRSYPTLRGKNETVWDKK